MSICRVAALRGVDWLAEAFAIFRRDPAIWIANGVLFGGLSLAASALPIIGPLASTLLQPVFLAGLMAGCREVERGNRLTIAHLFAGFRANTAPLLVLGLILGLATFAILLVMFAPFAAMMGLGYFGSSLMETPDWPDAIPAEIDPAMAWASLAVLGVAMLLAVPVAMAGWFAPALVMLRNVGAVEALKTSFLGCLQNVWPLSVYGLLLMVASLVAMIPFTLGLLVLVPVGVISFYTAYRDIFRDPSRG